MEAMRSSIRLSRGEKSADLPHLYRTYSIDKE